tara:strand:+ start:1400 stop:2446 length:1047 start_codon:yes stop_codon:yes gene_type:complete
MAHTGINKCDDYFKLRAYDGSGSNVTISDLGFNPDLTWIKKTDSSSAGEIYSTVRGVTKYIIPSTDDQEDTNVNGLTAFGTGGWTVGGNGLGGSGNYISYNWKAGTTSGLSGGSITPDGYSLNTTAGISIIKYEGTGSAGATIAHGLGVTPNLIIIKKLSGADNWTWKSDGGVSGYTGFTKYMYPNNSGVGVATDSSNEFQHSPNSTTFTLGNNGGVNGSGAKYEAWCFANKTGFSRVAGYRGNGSSDGVFLHFGFKPKWVVVHRLDSGDAWAMVDDVRDAIPHPNNYRLYWHQNNAQDTSIDVCDFLWNGIKFRTSDGSINDTGGVYVIWAIGQTTVGTNNVPATAR